MDENTRICRICLGASDEDLYSIYDSGKVGNKTLKITDILTDCTSIEVNSKIQSTKLEFTQNAKYF